MNNRQIKFRLWLPQLKKMTYDDFYIDYQGRVFSFTNGDFVTGRRRAIFLDEIEQVNDYVLQQFTGLKDKDLKEIYEGDIIQQFVIDGFDDVGTVEFIRGAFYFVTLDKSQCNPLIVSRSGPIPTAVLGTIYENPELLNDQ